jgi:uncharacterized protein (TIGR02687 family)
MSDLKQIQSALHRLFHDEANRIVFWNDPDREFEDFIETLTLDGVTTVLLHQSGALDTKIRIDRLEIDTKFLLYSPAEEPEYEIDWLLDIRLFSRSFRADRASILLQELGLASLHLRTHLADRRKFFDAKDRLQRLKSLVEPNDVAPDLDRKMIAVITKAEQAEPFNLIRTLFNAWTDSQEFDLDEPPAIWGQIEKFELDVPFWQMVKSSFGYDEESPNLKNLLLRLFATDFAFHLKAEVPQPLQNLVLPKSGWSNAVVCLAQWRDSSSKGASYDRLSTEASNYLKIDDLVARYDLPQLMDVMTFLVVEKRIASSLRDLVQSTIETINADEVRSIANRRQTGHWAALAIADTVDAPRSALNAVYDALIAAADFYSLRNEYKIGFEFADASALVDAYQKELYRFDQLYRHFCESADHAEAAGWGILKPLRGEFEAHYVNWYLTELSLVWGKFVESPEGLLGNWKIAGIQNQFRFYSRHVQPWLEKGDDRRAFVIISDAFRFEAAQELSAELNGKYRLEATLTAQLGVLPSYTALGMASLLPHQSLSYKGTDVLVDGKSSIASERDTILQSVGGAACKYDELMSKRKEEGREFIKDKRVLYIYHDAVDSTGDDAKTEDKTFDAVRRAIDELAALISFIVNSLNGNHIVVTADHGFLFTESAPVETDKSKIDQKPDSAIVAKKRYLVGRSLGSNPTAWHGKISQTSNVEGDMEFWIPKGANLFHFVGGARFVHGGAMPQEIVVPVITVKQIKGKSAADTKTKHVSIQVLGANYRITTGQHRFELIQMDAVSDRVKPITLKIAVYDGSEPVTNVQNIKFDSTSSSLDDRKKWVSLVLTDRQYNKKTPYRLVLQDAETGIEQQSVEVIIDRAFDDF